MRHLCVPCHGYIVRFDEFKTLAEAGEALPTGLSAPLAALYHDRQGDWELAHREAQEAGSREGDLVHAYLHRKEGDGSNAEHWYTRAGRTTPDASVSFDEEWETLTRELIGN